MRGVGHDADVDAVLVVRIEDVLEHHGAAALAPFGTALAVDSAEIVGRLLGCIDMRVPIDDHALLLVGIGMTICAKLLTPRSAGTAAAHCRAGWPRCRRRKARICRDGPQLRSSSRTARRSRRAAGSPG